MNNTLSKAVLATTDVWALLATQLQEIRALGQCGCLVVGGQRLRIHGGEARYLDESGVVSGWLNALSNSLNLAESFKLVEFERLMPDSSEMVRVVQKGRSLDELLWITAWLHSDGQLLSGCRRDDVVSFHRWPNLSRLPHLASTHRIVALLTQRPSSIVLASRLLKIPEDEIAQVYCAGQRAGYAAPINRQVEEPVTRTHRHQSLITRLMTRLQRHR